MKKTYVFLIPGMLAPSIRLRSLAQYLQADDGTLAVRVVPLRCSLSSFENLVARAADYIKQHVTNISSVETVLLFGYSHGGRVAAALAPLVKKQYPNARIVVVTAGTPMAERPRNLPLYKVLFFHLSRAYRQWPLVKQPQPPTVERMIGYYSDDDRTVAPVYATSGYQGVLVKKRGFSHTDFIDAQKFGPDLHEFLSSLAE